MQVEQSSVQSRNEEGKGTAVRAWRIWRSKHPSPLEEALKDPHGWALYSRLLKETGVNPADYRSYQEWVDRNPAQIRWRAWRRRNPAPLREVLRDPEAWDLFSAMKAERGEAVASTFEDWIKEQEARRAGLDSAWRLWRDAHAGPLREVLRDPEGLRLFVNERGLEAPGDGLSLEEWLSQPRTQNALAVEEWTAWRRTHPSSLAKAFDSPEGFPLYRTMMLALNKRPEETVEEWRWKAYRRAHAGPLDKVLMDLEAWQTFHAALEKKMLRQDPSATVPRTLEEFKERRRLQNTQSQSEQQEETRPRRKRARRGRQRRTPSAELRAWESWKAAHAQLPLWQLLEQHPEGWPLYEAAFRSTQVSLPERLEDFVAQQRAQAEWEDWRRAHRGPLLRVLHNAEGWTLYRRWKEHASSLTRSTTALGSDAGCCEVEEKIHPLQKATPLNAARDWLIWQHLQHTPSTDRAAPEGERASDEEGLKEGRLGLLDLLERSDEGWELFSALLASVGTCVSGGFEEFAKRAGEVVAEAVATLRQQTPHRRSLENYALQKALAELSGRPRFPSFNAWRKQGGARGAATCEWQMWRGGHRGPMAEALADPEGWALYKQMLSEKGKEVPDSFEEWLRGGSERRAPLSNWLAYKWQHKGALQEILRDPVAFDLFKTAFPKRVREATHEEFLLSLAVSADWRKWRESHAGPLERVLKQHPEGWELFRRNAEAKGRLVPESFEAWLGLKRAKKPPRAATDSQSSAPVVDCDSSACHA